MKMASALKTIVSKNKNRHVEVCQNRKYDLDLTYITDRIIAMGYPAEKIEAVYRNDYNDVKEFLDQKHGEHYWVYNLCSEKDRNYDKKKFDDRVTCYPFDDHHPPVFRLIQPFCEDVQKYLDKDERNVAVVHCKAGKGRTGVMVCCYLLHIGISKSAEEVLKMYGEKRTADQKGVTIPSQRRYITYYDTVRRRSLEYKPVKLYLKDIVLDPMPNFTNSSQYYIYFEVRQRSRKPFEYKLTPARKGDRNVSLSINPPLLLTEDTKFEFFTKAKYETHIFNANSRLTKWAKGERAFHFWLNTFFVDKEIEGSLAHDLTVSNPIETQIGTHQHHASGSSEDSSAEDVPLRLTSTSNGGHHDLVDSIGNNFQKQVSTSDDHLLRQTDGQHNVPTHHISPMGPLSSSSENNASIDSISSTTPESFRIRHVSMPQHSVRTQPQCEMTHHGNSNHGHIHNHHPNIEGRLSHGIHHGDHQENSKQTSLNNHATITSQTSCMTSSGGPHPKIYIPGKQLSLRLRKNQIDKAHKDKASKTFPENFSVTLFLVKPDEDQSDHLIDYSLYSQPGMWSSSAMNSCSTITATGGAHLSSGEKHHQFTITPVSSASSLNPTEHKQRSRPLTGESGASSSSATPSLKSMEHSSQESAASSDEGGPENMGGADYQTKDSSKKNLKLRTTLNNRANSASAPSTANPSQPQQPQSTWI